MDIVEKMRSFESDHEPDGWPAVTMGQISALCDQIDRLNSELNTLQSGINCTGYSVEQAVANFKNWMTEHDKSQIRIGEMAAEIERLNVANDQITKAQIDNYKLATDAWDSNKLLREENASLQSIIKTACNSLPVAFSPDEKTGENLVDSIDTWRKHVIERLFNLANKANKFEESSNRYFLERNKLRDEINILQSIIDEANAQEPVALFCSLSPNNFRWVSGGYLCEAKHGDRLYSRPIPAQQSPRITDQDAREIVEKIARNVPEGKSDNPMAFANEWALFVIEEAKELLTKLNEAKHD